MDWPIISKKAEAGAIPANLAEYREACRDFSWEQARSGLAGLPGGRGINIAYEAVDRHVAAGRGAHIALRWLAREGDAVDFSYSELQDLSNRFANALDALGVRRGERVFTLLGRVPALYVAALGTWKHGAVLCPLFAAFGPEPIAARMAIAEPSVLVVSARLFERKIRPILDRLPTLRHIVLVEQLARPGARRAGVAGIV